jgi:uncharacterized membrane protein
MASRASIGGHPIHPMLIPFPIGLLVYFLCCGFDLPCGEAIRSGRITLRFTTMLGGIIGAAAAAIPGLIDWATLSESRDCSSGELARPRQCRHTLNLHR